MALPWLVVGKLILNNLDSIIGVVKPAFTRKKADTVAAETELLNEQIKELAAQLEELVASLEQGATEAATDRAAIRRLAYVAIAISAVAILTAGVVVFAR